MIGSWLCRELVERGASVVALVQDIDSQSELLRSGTYNHVSTFTGQLQDFTAVERVINEGEVDTVMHLGAQAVVGTAARSPLGTWESNVHGTYNVLEACRIHGDMVKRVTSGVGCELVFEPGRVIVGNAGVLVSRVLYVKRSTGHTFTVLDAAMNDLLRPSLYNAHHAIVPAREPAPDATTIAMDIVGPICESGDVFAQSRPMPPLVTDDLLVIRTAGAYGAAMSSNYNSRPLAAEVLVNGDVFEIVRRRQSTAEMLSLEQMPSWLHSRDDDRKRGAA